MKVIIICPKSPRVFVGGLENFSLRLAERLISEGKEAVIYATAPKPVDNKIGNVPVKEFPAFAPSNSYFLSLEMFSALKKCDADIVHSVGYNNLLTFEAMLAKKKNQKLVVSINLSGDPPFFRKILNFFYDIAINFFKDRIDEVICVSPPELSQFRGRLKLPPEKFTLIPMGIDIDAIRAVKAGKKGNYILSAGRFVKVKQFHNLIPSFALLSKKMPGVRLVILGSGPMEEELKKLATESGGVGGKISFEKSVPLERISELHKKMKESLMFVNLVDCGYEGIISYDAMACEVPVLLCDRKGKLEYVEKGYAQAITNPEDHAEVSEKMLEILKNPGKYTPRNPDIHSWQEVTGKTIAVYEKALGKRYGGGHK